MKYSTGRELIRTVTLSVLALTAISGVAIIAAGPAMSQPNDRGSSSAQQLSLDQPDPTLTPTPTPVPPLPVP
ncbi:MAG: hypothetical protein QOG46_983 [Pseudonocardiales bacterium]|jgi:hypothetical protein|nr:hypothetical protein [Pseudonocardiales bacterium]